MVGAAMAWTLLLGFVTEGVGLTDPPTRPKERYMNAFSPEFSAYWLDEPAVAGERESLDSAAKKALSPSQQVALEELVERVNAARSIV
jgi:hypothetical protein